MSPRSNTEIMGGTGDQRVTIDDCTRFWMSCTTQTKWIAPFKMTSEVSKEVSVVTELAFRLEHYFPILLVLLLRMRRKCEKGFLIIQISSPCAFSKGKYKLCIWVLNEAGIMYPHSQKYLWDTRK
jgi:hypothetical protein